MRLNYYGPNRYDFRGGWGSAGTEILIPLGPQHLLYTKVGSRPLFKKGERVSEELFDGFQRMTIEHAHRFVFADQQNSEVAVVRPRTVDAVLYRSETEQWKRWHDEQSQAERELLTGSVGQSS